MKTFNTYEVKKFLMEYLRYVDHSTLSMFLYITKDLANAIYYCICNIQRKYVAKSQMISNYKTQNIINICKLDFMNAIKNDVSAWNESAEMRKFLLSQHWDLR